MNEMQHITDAVLRRAVLEIPVNRFDSHDLYKAIMRVAPRAYAFELYRCADSDDPFEKLHPQIARRLATHDLHDLCRQTYQKQISQNVRGQDTRCEVWEK